MTDIFAIYALAIKAEKCVPQGVQVEMTAAATRNARSEEEAYGIGLRLAKGKWLLSEGWHNHAVFALSIPVEWIANQVDHHPKWPVEDDQGCPRAD